MNFLNILTFATSAALAVAVRSEPQLRASAERQLSVGGTPRALSVAAQTEPRFRQLEAPNDQTEVLYKICSLSKEANH